MDRKESKLTKAEKRAAKKSYEDEKRASVPYSRPSYAPYYPTSDQALSNMPMFNQRGWYVLTFGFANPRHYLPGAEKSFHVTACSKTSRWRLPDSFLSHLLLSLQSGQKSHFSLISFPTSASVFEQLSYFCIFRRHISRPDDKPVASVRPIQSTPIPMMPRQVGVGMGGSSSSGSLPVNFLQKAGVQVQRIVTTTGDAVWLNTTFSSRF